ncbi:MAG: chromosome segregation protein SMC [Sedimentisphaerales bacterium]|nr:chromosome segregation protein SMC [Sedimentisphaerales bacterium]
MRLEKIAVNGFKSFADRIEFDFVDGITAIVGPNGCGKSNVVDAVKWVLGNQSPKSLRSGQMSDVIFSGSSNRKASGMAQVSLRFSDVNALDIEQDELEITRRLYRSGESEYLINNKTCRLKDIKELFMDTGVGVSAYSIIEQGQIDQLLHASKADRRIIFEEAAGISKYKAHKKEALRKLERTEQNMLRLADIVAEVQKQLRSIKLQAGKARNYLQYSEKLKELRVNYSLSEYDKIVNQTKKKKQTLAGHEEKFAAIAARVAKDDAVVSELGKTIIETENRINQSDNALVAAKSRIDQQLDRIEMLKSRIEELQQRKQNATEQIRNIESQQKEFSTELSACNDELEENKKLFAAKNNELVEMEKKINALNTECSSIDADLEDEKSGIIDIVRRTAQLHNEIQSMNTYRSNLSGQKERLDGRASTAQAQLQQLLTEKAQYSTRLSDINKVIEDLELQLGSKRDQMSSLGSERDLAGTRLTDIKEQRSALKSEFNILSDMESRQQGLSTSLKHILQNARTSHSYIGGIVADAIEATEEYADAVEAALEGKTDMLLINSTQDFLADKNIHSRLQSRVKFICTEKIEPFVETDDLSRHPGVLGRLIEFVKYDQQHAPLAWKLLGHTVLVDSLDSAIKLSRDLGPKYRFVTKAGQVFNGDNTISIGPVGSAEGLISRKSRLSQLQTELEALLHQIEQIDSQIEKNNRQNDHLEKLCKDFRTSIYEANTEKIDLESKLQIIEQDVKRLSDEQPVITSEIEMLQQEITQSVQKEYDSKQKLDELESINGQRTSHIELLEKQFADKKALLDSEAAKLTDLKVSIGQISEQQKSVTQRISSLQAQLQHGRMSLEASRSEFSGCDEQLLMAQRSILSSQAKVSELYVEKETAQKDSQLLHRKVDELFQEQKNADLSLRQGRTEQAQVEEQIHEVKLQIGQLSVKDEDLTQRVAEELQIDLAQAYNDFEQSDIDWDQVREEIAELRGKIERLGNVNVDAIDEQEELEQRFEFLSQQAEDLNKSKTQLEQLIARINRESVEKFRTTFEEVRANFQVLFRKLFGGGKADIFLEDPEDILECGIEIVARPPGKETRSISLLSGGEKTLTALGLLFSVFRSKPSPFCFLDEVDAALDEANNERFNAIVQEFQKDSQFVIITHSKRTMSIADVLFGVTMQTQGVSKKISVKFDSIDSETEEAAVA